MTCLRSVLFCFSEVIRCRWLRKLAMVLTFPDFTGNMFFHLAEGTPKPSVGQCYPRFIGRSTPASCFIAACQAPVMPAQLLCWVWECLFIYRLTEFDLELSSPFYSTVYVYYNLKCGLFRYWAGNFSKHGFLGGFEPLLSRIERTFCPTLYRLHHAASLVFEIYKEWDLICNLQVSVAP